MTYRKSINTFFFFNDTATTEIYTLSLHDALPISIIASSSIPFDLFYKDSEVKKSFMPNLMRSEPRIIDSTDRKSTRLNSSHSQISYAVFCLKKKKRKTKIKRRREEELTYRQER